jgi:hypothetical protein
VALSLDRAKRRFPARVVGLGLQQRAALLRPLGARPRRGSLRGHGGHGRVPPPGRLCARARGQDLRPRSGPALGGWAPVAFPAVNRFLCAASVWARRELHRSKNGGFWTGQWGSWSARSTAPGPASRGGRAYPRRRCEIWSRETQPRVALISSSCVGSSGVVLRNNDIVGHGVCANLHGVGKHMAVLEVDLRVVRSTCMFF